MAFGEGGSASLRIQPLGKSRALQISRAPSTGLDLFSSREMLKSELLASLLGHVEVVLEVAATCFPTR